MLTRRLRRGTNQFGIEMAIHAQQAMCRFVPTAYLTGVLAEEGFEEPAQHVSTISDKS